MGMTLTVLRIPPCRSNNGSDKGGAGNRGRRYQRKLGPRSHLRRCLRFLNSLCGGTDDIEHTFRLGKHWDVAAVELVGGCAHALGEKTLQVGMHGVVFFADDVPAWLRLPGSSSSFR